METPGLPDLGEFTRFPREQVVDLRKFCRGKRSLLVQFDGEPRLAEPKLRNERHVEPVERIVEKHYGTVRADLRSDLPKLPDDAPRLLSQFPHLRPHFIILSPHDPHISTEHWPAWMRKEGSDEAHWVRMPAPNNLLKVTRCDERAIRSAVGGWWKVEQDSVSARIVPDESDVSDEA